MRSKKRSRRTRAARGMEPRVVPKVEGMRRVVVDETTEPPFGIDVSHHNGIVDWSAVARAGVMFAFAKATEGALFRDRRFPANWVEMRESGILRGAYHFFRPSVDAVTQADHFCDVVGALGPGDLPPVVDVEETPKEGEWEEIETAEERVGRLEGWVTRVRERTGRTPIVYTARSFWRRTFNDSKRVGDVPLWIARWSTKPPVMPTGGWSEWTFWQYADDGAVAGINGLADVNRFNGDGAALRALAESRDV